MLEKNKTNDIISKVDDFMNKVCLVIDSTSGIGLATAKILSKNNTVIINAEGMYLKYYNYFDRFHRIYKIPELNELINKVI